MSGRLFVWVHHTSQFDGNTGVQRVTRSIASTLEQLKRDIVYVNWDEGMCAPKRVERGDLEMLSRHAGPKARVQASSPGPIHMNGLDDDHVEGAWMLVPEVTYLGAANRSLTADLIDYCHSRRMKIAFIFYDLIPMQTPGYETARGAHEDYVQQLALADLVIPISRYAELALREYYTSAHTLPASEMPAIASASLGEQWSSQRSVEGRAVRRDRRRKIVCLGTVEARKNQIGLLRAFEHVCRSRDDIELHIVGKLSPSIADEFRSLCDANPRVRYRGSLPDEEVADLIAASEFTVFPSLEEGYGLPIVESLWMGCPVICANFGAMAEVGEGGGGWLIDVTSDRILAEAIEKLASDNGALIQLREAARDRHFKSWITYVEDIEGLMRDHAPLRRVWFYVDATVRMSFNSGIQRVARSLGRALQDARIDVRFLCWDSGRGMLRELEKSEALQLAKWNGPSAAPKAFIDPSPGDWLIIPEILLSPGPLLDDVMSAASALGLRTSTILFDLIPLKLSSKWPEPPPEVIYDRATAEAYEAFWQAAAQSDAIFPISRAVGKDLLAYLKRSIRRQVNLDNRTIPIPLGGNFASGAREIRRRVDDGEFVIVSVGTIEPRKNHLRFLKGFIKAAALPGAPVMKLIIVGSQKAFPDLAVQLKEVAGAHSGIEFVEFADDQDMRALIDGASVVAYPSFEEGFGLPILESLWCGRACLCHDEGALGETAAGGGVLTINMLDVDAIADGISKLATQPGLLAELTSEAEARQIKSWLAYGREVANNLARLDPPSKAVVRAQSAFKPTPIAALKTPILSICISNSRADWLTPTVQRVLALARPYRDVVEILVVSSAADQSAEHLASKLPEHDQVDYIRSQSKPGIGDGLDIGALHASGEYVWFLTETDILLPGAIEDILDGILDHPEAQLIYLNHANADFEPPGTTVGLDQIVSQSRAVSAESVNGVVRSLREVLARNDSMLTARGSCIFRRKHALRAYSHRHPTRSKVNARALGAVYAVDMMLDLPAYWVARPSVVVGNGALNSEDGLLWELVHLPDLFDLADRSGINRDAIDQYRWSHSQNAASLVRQVYFGAHERVRAEFSIETYIARLMHIDAFRSRQLEPIKAVYREAAMAEKLSLADPEPELLFARLNI